VRKLDIVAVVRGPVKIHGCPARRERKRILNPGSKK